MTNVTAVEDSFWRWAKTVDRAPLECVQDDTTRLNQMLTIMSGDKSTTTHRGERGGPTLPKRQSPRGIFDLSALLHHVPDILKGVLAIHLRRLKKTSHEKSFARGGLRLTWRRAPEKSTFSARG